MPTYTRRRGSGLHSLAIVHGNYFLPIQIGTLVATYCKQLPESIKEKRFRDLAKIADGLHAYDNAFGSFRWEHLQIVQRIIGEAVGTAGTSNYLQRKTREPFLSRINKFPH